MTDVNDRQVGGSHYATGDLQHWDLFGLDYLIGYATKYMRWKKKGGIEDLQKAIHVIEKIKEYYSKNPISVNVSMPVYDPNAVTRWCSAAGLDWTETQIVMLIMFARDISSFDQAIAGIRHLIEQHTKKSQVEKIQRTPEDGAHHTALYPWVANKQRLTKLELDSMFYIQRTKDIYVLSPFVISDTIPSSIGYCYFRPAEVPDMWVLRIENCPKDVRDFFPDLQMECNLKEWQEKQLWIRGLYEWLTTENKFRLIDKFKEWHVKD